MAGRCSTRARARAGVVGSDRGDGGGAALVWLLLAPAVFALIFGGVQVGMTGYAKGVALAAAQAGVQAAAAAPADPNRAAPAAEQFLHAKAPDTLPDATIPVTGNGTTITVTVIGHCASIVPWLHPLITQSASGPLEPNP